MAFDIHQRVFDEDGFYDEAAGVGYLDEIMARFSTSPEGQEVAAKLGAMGWSYIFVDYGMSYLGVTPPEMSPAEVEEILFDIITDHIRRPRPARTSGIQEIGVTAQDGPEQPAEESEKVSDSLLRSFWGAA